ncbi:MAG: YfhO family protein [Planctomycetota bacterium]|jgi:hypothetical protein
MNNDQSTLIKPHKISPQLRRWLVGSSIVLLPVVVLLGAWRLGGASGLEDDLIYYLPIRQYIGQQIQSGLLPLWNPLNGMGKSIAADPQSGLWYPPTYLFALFGPLTAYSLTIILHFALAGGGMYRFLRSCRHDWRAALLGAIAFEFCGYLVGHRAHLTIFQAVTWVPWILLGWRKFADRADYRYFVLACICLGLQMLIQHIQISIITCTLLTGYVALVLWPRRRSLWWQFPAGICLGVMISSIQLLPTWFYYRQCARQVPAYHLFIENSWEPASALMFFFPMLFGSRTPNLWDQPWWGVSHFCEQFAYGSILILILAVASYSLIRRNREVAFWWAASLLALFIALGDLNPLSKLLFHIPVYRNLRVPARWIMICSLAMPILASTVTCILLGAGDGSARLKRAIVWARRGVMLFALIGLNLVLAARVYVNLLTQWYPSEYFRPVWEGLKSSIYLGNPAIWWPILVILLTSFLVSYWAGTRKAGAFVLLCILCLVDLAAVAAFVDVDTRTYSRSDITSPPPLVQAINQLDPQPGDRLLVPRFSADYHRPIEVLWPSTNIQHRIATFHDYGPLSPAENQMLFRFMPWGSSEDMLSLLRNHKFLKSMGVRFVAVRSKEERALLKAAMYPPLKVNQVKPISDTEQLKPVCAGNDLLWPVKIESIGIYQLTLDAQPGDGSASRWFVGLETVEGTSIGKTRSMVPADLVTGPRRFRFLFNCPSAIGKAYVRVKSESGSTLSVGRATFGRVAAPPVDEPAPIRTKTPYLHRADLPGGISLYELPGNIDLVRWADQIEPVNHLLTAVERLQAHSDQIGLPTRTILVGEGYSPQIQPLLANELNYCRISGHELQIEVDSPAGGFLIFNETYDPGWRATIDAEPVAIIRANVVCQAVRVPGGRHEVRFLYRPKGILAGAGTSLIAILVLAAVYVATFRAHRT